MHYLPVRYAQQCCAILICFLFSVSAHAACETGNAIGGLTPPSVPSSSSTGSYQVSNISYTLCEKKNNGAWQSVSSSGSVKSFSGKGNGTYSYMNWKQPVYGGSYCAMNGLPASYCQPQVSGVDSIVVNIPLTPATPAAPQFIEFNGDHYTVSWNAVSITTHYELYEGSQHVYTGAATRLARSGLGGGGQVYKVRACNAEGCSGWSPTSTVQVPGGLYLRSTEMLSRDGHFTVYADTFAGAQDFRLSGSGAYPHQVSSPNWNITNRTNGTYSYNATFTQCPMAHNCFPNQTSSWVTVTVDLDPPATPAAPTLSGGGTVSNNSQMPLQWAAGNGPTVQRYELERDGAVIANSLTSASYTDTASVGVHSYRVRACNDGGCSAWSGASALLAGGGSQAIQPSTAVGQLGFNTGVDAKGQASISIPLNIIPGINGQQPALSIAYNTAREEKRLDEKLPQDTLGKGWYITGESEIHSCPQFSANWEAAYSQLCLDGEPLNQVTKPGMSQPFFYALRDENFSGIETVSLYPHLTPAELLTFAQNNPNLATHYFKVTRADGTILEYGRDADAYLRSYVGTSVTKIWKLSSSTDVFGNRVDYRYHKNQSQQNIYLRDIRYGNSAQLDFLYVQLQAGKVLLNAVHMSHHGVQIRDYRFNSLVQSNYVRLQNVQLCAYDAAGANPQCVDPLSIEWDGISRVTRIADGHGRAAQFSYTPYELYAPDYVPPECPLDPNHPVCDVPADAYTDKGTFTENPFGTDAYGTITRERPLTVVNQLQRSNGVGGWFTSTYAYRGYALQDARDGFLGFREMRIHEPVTGITTYRQFEHWGKRANLVREHRYLGAYPGGQMLTKVVNAYTQTPLTRGMILPEDNNGQPGTYPLVTHYHYRHQSTRHIYHEGQFIGAKQTTVTPSFANFVLSQLSTQSQWADNVNSSQALSGIYRTHQTDTHFLNNTSAAHWLIGFTQRTESRQYEGATTLAQTQVQTATQYSHNSRPTLLAANTVAFPGDPSLQLQNSFSYDGAGRLISTTQTGAYITSGTQSIAAYEDGRYPDSVQNALGHTITSDYDWRFGQPTRITDANGRVTQLGYDVLGRERSRITPDGYTIDTDIARCGGSVACPMVNGIAAVTRVQVTSPVSPTATEYHDALGRTLRRATIGFDGVTEIYQDTHYDGLGRVFRESLPYFANNTTIHYTTYSYDNLSRVTLVERPDLSNISTVYEVNTTDHVTVTRTTETVRNAAGNVIGNKVQISRSHYSGDLRNTTDAVGTAEQVSTGFDYYGTGLPRTVWVNDQQMAHFQYDAAGNRKHLTDASIGTVHTFYTALGQVRWQQDNAGNITTTTYDVVGRPLQESTADGTANWVYDPVNAKGALASSEFIDARAGYGHSTTLSYNTSAKLTDSSVAISAPGLGTRHYAQSLGYDGYGRVTHVGIPSGLNVQQHYTAAGYLSHSSNVATGQALSTTVAVNALGQVTNQTLGNGITTARYYDARTGRLTGITTQGSTTIQNNTYQWRSDGLLSQRASDTVSNKVETFGYDALNRLTHAVTEINGVLQRVTSTGFALNGNILHRSSDDGSDNVMGFQYGTTTYAGPHAVSAVTIKGMPHTLHYDANGGITHYDAQSGADRYVQWAARGKPQTITKGSSASDPNPVARDEFAYNEAGLRYYKKSTWNDAGTPRSEHTFYIGNFEDVIPGNDPLYTRIEKTRLSDSVMHLRLTEPGQVTQRIEYLHRDHLGSVEAVTDEAGNTLMQFSFEAFGARRKADWTGLPNSAETEAMLTELHRHTSRGYTGHEHLDRTGLIHMNGRVYDPVLGRFLSPDPLVQAPAYSQSYNRYTYVWNNPLGMTDPTGYAGSEGGVARRGGRIRGTWGGTTSLMTREELVRKAGCGRFMICGSNSGSGNGDDDDANKGHSNTNDGNEYVGAQGGDSSGEVTYGAGDCGNQTCEATINVIGTRGSTPLWITQLGARGRASQINGGGGSTGVITLAGLGGMATLGSAAGMAIGVGIAAAVFPSSLADSTGSGDPLNQIFRVVNAGELAVIIETGQFPPSLSGFGEKQFWQAMDQATTWQAKVTKAGWESSTFIVSTLVRGETLQQAFPVNEPGVGVFYSFGANAMPALNADAASFGIYQH